MKLTIVIPAYNEEQRIRPMLGDYAEFFASRYGDQVEMIVVINGSHDGTEAVVRSMTRTWPQIRVLVEPRSIGKGGAVLMGLAVATGDCIGFVDADGSTSPRAFQDLVDHIGDAGAIIASRWRKDSAVSPKQPLARRVASRIFNFLVRFLFRLSISDTQCGAKLLKREAALHIAPHICTTHWGFDVDLLFQLRRAGYRIIEYPTTWHDVAGSKLNIPLASTEMLLAIIRLRLLYSPFKWIVDLYNRMLGPILHKN